MERPKGPTLASRPSLFSVRAALRTNAYARTPRKPNWSEVECEYLLTEIQSNLSVIRSRKPDFPGSRKSPKTDIWNRMCMGLHAKRPTVMRSVRELKDKWKKLQFMAKQHISSARLNALSRRSPEGLVIIPKLVYRVLEARGQDPKRAGFCCDPYTMAAQRNSRPKPVDNPAPEEQTTAAAVVEPDEDAVKEEIVDIDQMFSDESPKEPDISLKIQSAVSLAPGYMQDHPILSQEVVGTSASVTDSLSPLPVSLARSGVTTQSNISSTSFSISSRLLQQKASKAAGSGGSRTYGQQQQQQQAAKSTQSASRAAYAANPPRRQHQQARALNRRPSPPPQPQFFQDVLPNPSPGELADSFPMEEPQDDVQDTNQLLSHGSSLLGQASDLPLDFGDGSEDPPPLPAGLSPRRCPKVRAGGCCDDRVVALQQEVLREERDKIRLEKEILGMQREKLKLELMVLRQKVNGLR